VVPPRSDRISRVPPYSCPKTSLTRTGLSPFMPAVPGRSGRKASGTGLVRVRSPLLAESLLMSFPPGTEMFQFPGFASLAGYSLRSGLPHSEIHGSKPVRGSPWLIAAYHVLHRLSAPRHPPNALKSLDHSHYRCPSALPLGSQTAIEKDLMFTRPIRDRRG
jgi:hypothetical protein